MDAGLLRRFVAVTASSIVLLAACGTGTAPTQTYEAPSAPPPTVEPTATPPATVEPTPEATLPFTPGTAAAPRVIEMTTDDLLNFTPGVVQAAVGETVTFRIHNVGTAVHEFMIGKLDDAFADLEGTPEVADIGPDQTAELTFTFDGTGPFAFACHAPGHFEHGMAGYIQLVGPGAPEVGTAANPRIVWLDMNDTLAFLPSEVTVRQGESIRFVLTNSGTAVHEFQVGPADKVAADEVDGVIVVEADELDAGSTHAVDYTFDGPGPFAFACHEPGHYEAGMHGTITIVPA